MSKDARTTAIQDMAAEIHENALRHGFYEQVTEVMHHLIVNDKPDLAAIVERDFKLAQLAKIASEIGEAVECIQKGMPDMKLAEEFADIIIRAIDLSEYCGFATGGQIALKMEKNASRPYLHGKLC